MFKALKNYEKAQIVDELSGQYNVNLLLKKSVWRALAITTLESILLSLQGQNFGEKQKKFLLVPQMDAVIGKS